MTVAPVSLSMRLPAVVDGLTYRADGRLLNPLAAYLTTPPTVTVAAHGGSVVASATGQTMSTAPLLGYETLD